MGIWCQQLSFLHTADPFKFDICTKVACHVHIVCLLATLHISRWRGRKILQCKTTPCEVIDSHSRAYPFATNLHQHTDKLTCIFCVCVISTQYYSRWFWFFKCLCLIIIDLFVSSHLVFRFSYNLAAHTTNHQPSNLVSHAHINTSAQTKKGPILYSESQVVWSYREDASDWLHLMEEALTCCPSVPSLLHLLAKVTLQSNHNISAS